VNHYTETLKFIANEVIQVGHTIIDPTTGTNESATVTSIGPNSHDAE